MPRIKENYSNLVALRLTDRQLAALKKYAYEEEETSMTQVIRDLLDDYLSDKMAAV